ncbi:MAG: c-type cytochrome [Pirellulaceae bacterium]
MSSHHQSPSKLKFLGSICVLLTVTCLAIESVAQNPKPAEAFSILIKTLSTTKDSQIRRSLMQGMLAGLEGRRNIPTPQGWDALKSELAADDDPTVGELASKLSQLFGDKEAADKSLSLLTDATAEISQRRSALHSLLSQQNASVSEQLETLLSDNALAIDAIRGYAAIENASAPAVLLGRYPSLTSDRRRVVIETLATRKSYATALLGAIKTKVVSADDIPVHVARTLSEILGKPFVDVYGQIRPVAADREKLLAKYKQLVTPASLAAADASRGRALFNKTCAACHLLYGEGGSVGPDLTGSNRANLDYILLNSVDPSYDVPDAYKMVQVLTTEGRVINGVLAEEDQVRIVLKTAEQPRVVIAKTDIETRRISDKSMMPDGQLDQMKRQEVVDLIKYLRTTEQVELAQ